MLWLQASETMVLPKSVWLSLCGTPVSCDVCHAHTRWRLQTATRQWKHLQQRGSARATCMQRCELQHSGEISFARLLLFGWKRCGSQTHALLLQGGRDSELRELLLMLNFNDYFKFA